MDLNEVLFDFERSHYALHRIPMIVRFKLDAIGLCFGFAAWATISHKQREELVTLPCDTEEEKQHYRRTQTGSHTANMPY